MARHLADLNLHKVLSRDACIPRACWCSELARAAVRAADGVACAVTGMAFSNDGSFLAQVDETPARSPFSRFRHA